MSDSNQSNPGDTRLMLDTLAKKGGDTQLRLFTVACCRVMWSWLTDERLRTSADVAERFAQGRASAEELATAHAGVRQAYDTLDGHDMDLEYRKECEAWATAVAASAPSAKDAANTAIGSIYWRDEVLAELEKMLETGSGA